MQSTRIDRSNALHYVGAVGGAVLGVLGGIYSIESRARTSAGAVAMGQSTEGEVVGLVANVVFLACLGWFGGWVLTNLLGWKKAHAGPSIDAQSTAAAAQPLGSGKPPSSPA